MKLFCALHTITINMKFTDINGKEHTFELRSQFGVKRKADARSISQWKLGRLVCRIYGRNNVFEDYPLPGCGNLSWDFWVPHQDIAFEFHGRQHDEFVAHFHGSMAGFRKQQVADGRKQKIADYNHVTLVVVREGDFDEWTVEELKEIITLELD